MYDQFFYSFTFQRMQSDQKQLLEKYSTLLKDRGYTSEAKKVNEYVQELQTAERIKKFYCNHSFQLVNTTFFGLQLKSRICSKCGFVK